MKSRFLLLILFLLPATSLAADDLFDIKPMADGVYAAISKYAYKVNCNAAIIILSDASSLLTLTPAVRRASPHRTNQKSSLPSPSNTS